MIEFKRQISEAPDICVVIHLSSAGKAWVDRFEDESGQPIAYELGEVMSNGQFSDTSKEFSRLMGKYKEEIDAALYYAKQFHEEYYVGE